jgi:hypothetical protein
LLTPLLSRRLFIQLLAAATPLAKGLVGEPPPTTSWIENPLTLPRSANFGLTAEGRALAPGGFYQEETAPMSALSFDISNNQIAASLSRDGKMIRACICRGVVSLPQDKIKGGVYCAKELLYGGPWFPKWSWKVTVDTADLADQETEIALVENLFPMFTQKSGDLQVHQLFFAPVDKAHPAQAPRAVIGIILIENKGNASHTIDVARRDGAQAVIDERALKDASSGPTAYIASDPLKRAMFTCADFDQSGILKHFNESKTASLRVAPHSVVTFASTWILSETAAEARATRQKLSMRTLSRWLADTLDLRRKSYGKLSIRGDSFTGESLVRFSELARQSALRSSDGEVRGGFLGSDVDVTPVNWTRDSYYSMLAMNMSDPALSRDSIPYLLRWGQPSQASGPGTTRFPGAGPVSQSLSNSVSGLAMASVYYRLTGDRDYFRARPEILRSAYTILEQVLASRRAAPMLFPSLYFSDGEARGDFHTGSNVAAWVAFSGMSRLAREVYGDDRAAQAWSSIARSLHEAIGSHCVGASASGERFYEGANADGTFVQGHDGEESETSLMPFYGFCDADDPRLLRHAALAMSPENPLYSSALDAIWWYNSGWSSATFPGWTTAMAGASDEAQIRLRLDRIRSLTDLDGSIWWWPYPYGSKDLSTPVRGDAARKCGWGAAVFLCRLIHDVLGISVDTPSRTVRFAPFTPWDSFAWRQARIGWNTFDFSLDRSSHEIVATIRNRNSRTYSVTVVLTPVQGSSLANASVKGGVMASERRIKHWSREALEVKLHLRSGEQATITGKLA